MRFKGKKEQEMKRVHTYVAYTYRHEKRRKKAQPLIVTNWPNNIDAGERTTIAEYTLPGFAHVKGIKMGLHN